MTVRCGWIGILLLAACQGELPGTLPPSDLGNPDKAYRKAPARFFVKWQTTKGEFETEFVRAWSPEGVDRVYSMVCCGYFTGVKFFRVVPGFVVQFGMHGNPKINNEWQRRRLPDEPRREPNRAWTITFATGGPNTRANQLFINLVNNPGLDRQGFVPVGRVVEGKSTIRKLYAGYGNTPSTHQQEITYQGNEFLETKFPKLDSIESATITNEQPR